MRNVIKTFLFTVALCAVAFAGAIKTWSSGETLTASDLNTTFQHIHNTMVGGHGARLVNADVSAAAAIAHTKMATPALLPKAWAQVGSAAAVCAASPCTILASSGVTSATRSGAGVYVITWSIARPNAFYTSSITAQNVTGATACSGGGSTTTTQTIQCVDFAGTPADSAFTIVLLDDDN